MKLYRTSFRIFFMVMPFTSGIIKLYSIDQETPVVQATGEVNNRRVAPLLSMRIEKPTYEQVAEQQKLIAQMMHTRMLKRYATAAVLVGYAAYVAKGWLTDTPQVPVIADKINDADQTTFVTKKYVDDKYGEVVKALSSPSFFDWTSLGGIPIPYVTYAGASGIAKSMCSSGFYLVLLFGMKYVFLFKQDVLWFSQEELNLKTRLEEVEVHALEVERDPSSVAKKQLLVLAANAYVCLLTRLAGFMEYQRACKETCKEYDARCIMQDPLALCSENLMVAIHEFVDDLNKLLEAKDGATPVAMIAKALITRMSERVNALIITYTHALEMPT